MASSLNPGWCSTSYAVRKATIITGQIACSLKRSSAVSSRAEESIAPPRVAPMPRAIDRASSRAFPLTSRSTEIKQGFRQLEIRLRWEHLEKRTCAQQAGDSPEQEPQAG